VRPVLLWFLSISIVVIVLPYLFYVVYQWRWWTNLVASQLTAPRQPGRPMLHLSTKTICPYRLISMRCSWAASLFSRCLPSVTWQPRSSCRSCSPLCSAWCCSRRCGRSSGYICRAGLRPCSASLFCLARSAGWGQHCRDRRQIGRRSCPPAFPNYRNAWAFSVARLQRLRNSPNRPRV